MLRRFKRRAWCEALPGRGLPPPGDAKLDTSGLRSGKRGFSCTPKSSRARVPQTRPACEVKAGLRGGLSQQTNSTLLSISAEINATFRPSRSSQVWRLPACHTCPPFPCRKAYVTSLDCDYYTDAIDYTQVKVLEEFEGTGDPGAARRAHGEVRVNRQIVGFKKIKFYTMENVGAGKLNMPEQEMHTTAFWLHFPAAFLARLTDFTPTEKQSGITGLGNALRTVAALLLMCDPRDLGVALSEEIAGGLEVFEPNLYLYDMYPGGVGQSAPLYRLAPELLRQTAGLLAARACEAGRPSCAGRTGETGERGKLVAARILAELIVAPEKSIQPPMNADKRG